MSQKFNFPTETVELPSKGLLYPENSPLVSGQVEMKYMTAKEEDILTNTNYIEQGTVIDKLLQSLIVSDIEFNQLLVGDKNALLVAARILGYGKDYEFTYIDKPYTVDLTTLKDKEVDTSLFKNRTNEFEYTLPHSGVNITFKLLTHGDEVEIEKELRGLRKITPDFSPEFSTRLRYIVQSVNGDNDKKTVNDFVNNHFLARDSREFRNYITSIQPDIDLRFFPEDGPEGGVELPIGVTFLWPDA